MIGANGSVRGKKEFEPSSLAAESEPLLGPHLEDYWSRPQGAPEGGAVTMSQRATSKRAMCK